jgi:hypothetical protein
LRQLEKIWEGLTANLLKGLKDNDMTRPDKGLAAGPCRISTGSQLEGQTMTAVIVAFIGIIFAIASWYSDRDLEDE